MIVNSKKLAAHSKKFYRSYPSNLSVDNISHFNANIKYRCPDLFLYFFRSVHFLPDSTLFRYRIWPLPISFPYFKKRIKHHSVKGIVDIQRSWFFQEIEKAPQPYLMIHDQWTLNYYHWMTQALPRLIMFLKVESSFILLLPKTYTSEFHSTSLKMLGVENWVSFETGKNYYRVQNLIYPSHDIQIGDYHDDLMKELSISLRKGGIPKHGNTRLFIQRLSKTERKIVNESEVLSTFLSWGFTIVNFETMNFTEQIKVAGEASILAGVHGAGLTNMLFMERGSKIFELTTVLNGEQYYYYTLSNSLGHEYYYQKCESEVSGKSVQEANLHVDIETLNKNLALMTSIYS